MMPIAASVSMSLMLPESTNSFMAAPDQIRGASPPRTPFAFARGAPRSPLRSGGRARGAPSPLCGQQQRVQSRARSAGLVRRTSTHLVVQAGGSNDAVVEVPDVELFVGRVRVLVRQADAE